ncbi:hypothetical protein M3Y99_01834300 [Aphelenchoides fujianensis]|nr:hypothetical protein M3Y99_01834300 [Aphelenchoides fujianensis]
MLARLLFVAVLLSAQTADCWSVVDGPSAAFAMPESRFRTPYEAAVMREKLRSVLRELQKDSSSMPVVRNPQPLPQGEAPTAERIGVPLEESEEDRQSAVSKSQLNRIASAMRVRMYGGRR